MTIKEQSLRNEYQALQEKLKDPAVFSTKNYPKLAKRSSELEKILELFENVQRLKTNKEDATLLSQDTDTEISQMAKEELSEIQSDLDKIESELAQLLTPKDSNDEPNSCPSKSRIIKMFVSSKKVPFLKVFIESLSA